MRQEEVVASKTSNSGADPIPFSDWATDIAAKKRLSGITELPRNSGLRRTSSKLALLNALAEKGAEW